MQDMEMHLSVPLQRIIINEGFDCIEDGIINAIISARKLLDYGFGKTSENGTLLEPDYPCHEIFDNKKEDYKENKNEKRCKCTDNKSIARIIIPTDIKRIHTDNSEIKK